MLNIVLDKQSLILTVINFRKEKRKTFHFRYFFFFSLLRSIVTLIVGSRRGKTEKCSISKVIFISNILSTHSIHVPLVDPTINVLNLAFLRFF